MHKANRALLFALGVAVFVAISLPRTAEADTITLNLTGANTSISPYPGPYLTLTLSVPTGGGDATINILGDTVGNYTYNFDEVGFNLSNPSVTLDSTTPLPSGWSLTTSANKQLSQFGKFNTVVGTNGGYPASINSLSFVLDGSFANASSVLTPNGDDQLAAAHVFVTGSVCNGAACATGFAGDATPTTPTPTPEPASLVLLGTGLLLTLAFIGRRRVMAAE